MSEVLNYAVHPVAALFPYIEGEAFREFVEDIRVNGQREPVVLDVDGRLLDGRNRARACQELGIDVKETRYSGSDVEAWIISHNVHRRHLTESQRALVAARLADMRQGARTDLSPIGEKSGTRRAEAAAALNVGTSSVDRAKVVLKSGDEDLIKKVEAGDMTVNKATQVIKGRDYPTKLPAATRIKQITELADRGATTPQIAKELGIGEHQVKNVARANGITIRADEVRGRARRRNHNQILDNLTETLEVAAMSLRDIDPDALDREEAQERLDSLTTSINAIRQAVKKIKESFHE